MASTVEIIFKAVTQAAVTEVNKLKTGLKNLKGGLNDTVQGLTGFNLNTLAGAGAVVLLAKGVQQAIKDYTSYADKVRELNRINGESSESNSRLIQLTDDLGLSIEELNTATTMAARNGIALSTDKLADMSAEFLALETPAERDAYALENFGRSGLSMIKVLEAGPDKIREMSGAVADNLVLTDAQVKKARELEIAEDNLGDTWAGMKMTLAGELVPALVTFLQKMQEGIDIGLKLKNWNNDLTSVFQDHEKEVRSTARGWMEYAAEMTDAGIRSGKINENNRKMILYMAKQTGTLDELTANYKANGIAIEFATVQEFNLERATNNATGAVEDNSAAVDDMRITYVAATGSTLNMNGALNEAAQKFKDAGGAAALFKMDLVGLDDIDPQFGNKIKSALDKLQFELAGGLPLQKVTDDIIAAFNAGKITPEQAQEMLNEAFVAEEQLQVKMGNITADEAAKNVSETLGVSLQEAYNKVMNIKGGLDSFPRQMAIDLLFNQVVTGGGYISATGSTLNPNQTNSGGSGTALPTAHINQPNQVSRDAGGPIYPGMYITDWMTTGGQHEVAVQTPGYVLTEQDAKDALAGARGGATITVTQIINTPLDYAQAAAELAEIYRRER